MATPQYQFTFGPYGSGLCALSQITSFHMRSFPQDDWQNWGIVWSENGHSIVLKDLTLDGDGDGLAVTYEWTGPVPAAPVTPPANAGTRSTVSAIKDFFQAKTRAVESFAISNVVNPLIEGANAAHNIIVDNPIPFDVANTGMDIYGVITGYAASAVLWGGGAAATATGVAAAPGVAAMAAGYTSAAAGTACFLLTISDGTHLVLEVVSKVTGSDDVVKSWEGTGYYKNTERYMPIVAIIDPLREGGMLLKNMRELKTIAPLKAADEGLIAQAPVAAAAAARTDNLAANAVNVMDKDSPALAAIRKAQAARLATAQEAAAKATAAAADLKRLAEKADKLNEEIKKFLTWKMHWKESTASKDVALNAWSVGNYAFNFPFVENYGEHIGDSPVRSLIPPHMSLEAASNLIHYLQIQAVAIGGRVAR
jgi:hypothetical protein